MNLFINSPSYYTQEYGIIDEIYQLCQRISHSINVIEYTDMLDTVGITPIVAPTFALENNQHAEIKLISLRYRMASISLAIDYTVFTQADEKTKKALIVDNVLKSFLVIKKRLKNNFNYEQIEKDIKNIVSISEDELRNSIEW